MTRSTHARCSTQCHAREVMDGTRTHEESKSWPDDADGDVFRRLESCGFNFAKEYPVDYNVDFDSWPPHPDAVKLLQERYGPIDLFAPEDDSKGIVLFRVTGLVSYERVASVQRIVTAAMRPYGGVCESWGVLH